MSLLKRGAVWWSYFYVDGIRHQYSTGTGNRRQAEAVEQKRKAETNARRHQLIQANPDLTFGELAARFLANASPRPHHLDRLKCLLPYFANVPVLRLTKSMAADYRRCRKAAKPVSDATVNRDLSVLRHILYWAVDDALILANPLARLRLVRERRVKRRVVSVEEETRLLAAAPWHLRHLVIAALDTGMRRGELLGQRWEEVDFARRLLSVTKSKTPEGEAREIPLTDRMFRLLWLLRQEQGVVFTYEGRALKFLKTAWKQSLRRAGLRHIRFHDLRHTFNTRLLEAGVLQEVRMALMGHATGSKVHSTYTHVEMPVKREAIARLQQWVAAQRQLQGGDDARTQSA